MVAAFAGSRIRRRFLVMVLRNIAKAVSAARHGVTRPRSSGERRIEKCDRQQAHERGENSAAILGAVVHKFHSSDK
jgi:hypothetical protein